MIPEPLQVLAAVVGVVGFPFLVRQVVAECRRGFEVRSELNTREAAMRHGASR